LFTDRALLMFLLGLIVALSVVVLVLLQPARIGRLVRTRRGLVVALSVSVVAVLVMSVDSADVSSGAAPTARPSALVPLATVLGVVKASRRIHVAPPDLTPSLAEASTDVGLPPPSSGCFASAVQSAMPACLFGDHEGNHTMVLYGDSHAGMWFQALDEIASRAHWKLIGLIKSSCPAAPMPNIATCADWQRYAIKRIKAINPDLLVISQWARDPITFGVRDPANQWKQYLESLLKSVASPTTTSVVIGQIPYLQGTECLARGLPDVQRCSVSPRFSFVPPYNRAERAAALAEGARYIDVTPWLCAKRCSPVIANYDVYVDGDHLSTGYTLYLEGVLAQKLGLN
jgi:hypothetical protein